METLIKKYFKAFSKKDIISLDKIFSNNIELVDWTTRIKTKTKVLKFNKKIFKSYKTISIKVEEIFYNNKNKSACCKILVKLNFKSIKVIDLIYFDKNKKIKKILAYTQ